MQESENQPQPGASEDQTTNEQATAALEQLTAQTQRAREKLDALQEGSELSLDLTQQIADRVRTGKLQKIGPLTRSFLVWASIGAFVSATFLFLTAAYSGLFNELQCGWSRMVSLCGILCIFSSSLISGSIPVIISSFRSRFEPRSKSYVHVFIAAELLGLGLLVLSSIFSFERTPSFYQFGVWWPDRGNLVEFGLLTGRLSYLGYLKWAVDNVEPFLLQIPAILLIAVWTRHNIRLKSRLVSLMHRRNLPSDEARRKAADSTKLTPIETGRSHLVEAKSGSSVSTSAIDSYSDAGQRLVLDPQGVTAEEEAVRLKVSTEIKSSDD